jgi:hypothetical protein
MIGAVVNQASNIVENVVVLGESPWSPPDGYICVDVTDLDPQPGIGWSYDPATQQFTPPVEPVEPENPSEGPTVI